MFLNKDSVKIIRNIFINFIIILKVIKIFVIFGLSFYFYFNDNIFI